MQQKLVGGWGRRWLLRTLVLSFSHNWDLIQSSNGLAVRLKCPVAQSFLKLQSLSHTGPPWRSCGLISEAARVGGGLNMNWFNTNSKGTIQQYSLWNRSVMQVRKTAIVLFWSCLWHHIYFRRVKVTCLLAIWFIITSAATNHCSSFCWINCFVCVILYSD